MWKRINESEKCAPRSAGSARSGRIWLALDTSAVGGVETHVRELSEALRAAEIDAVIVRIKQYGEHPLFDRDGAPETIVCDGTADFLRRLRRERPSMLHTHGYKAGLIGRLVARSLGAPVVSTFHAGERARGRLALYAWLDRKTARLATALCVSDDIKTRVRSARQVNNFVTLEDGAPEFSRPGERRFAFVGRFSHEKGVDRFCALAAGSVRGRFIAFGDGPMMKAARALAGDAVEFRGVETDVRRIWSKVDVLCMPSRAEGLPMTALEAGARGIPVLGAPVGELPKLLAGGGGRLIAGDEADGWARAVESFNAMPAEELARIGARARATVRRDYSPEAVLPQILNAYETAGWRRAAQA